MSLKVSRVHKLLKMKIENTSRIYVKASLQPVAANRHPGQVGYSHNPPQEGRDEESSLRADSSEEGEGQAAHAAACAALERQCQSDLPLFRGVQSALLHLEETL